MSTDNDLATRAATERKRRKWTQEQVADKANMSLRAYQAFEAGESRPQKANLRSIVSVLNLEAEARETRSTWPPDVQVFLDVMGAYLSTLSDGDRIAVIHDLTRQIFEPRS